jgi:hypothetical protein
MISCKRRQLSLVVFVLLSINLQCKYNYNGPGEFLDKGLVLFGPNRYELILRKNIDLAKHSDFVFETGRLPKDKLFIGFVYKGAETFPERIKEIENEFEFNTKRLSLIAGSNINIEIFNESNESIYIWDGNVRQLKLTDWLSDETNTKYFIYFDYVFNKDLKSSPILPVSDGKYIIRLRIENSNNLTDTPAMADLVITGGGWK